MPFKSEKQRKWMWANDPEMAKKWEKEEKMKQETKVRQLIRKMVREIMSEDFAGAYPKEKRAKFDKMRQKQSEVLGYKLVGKPDIKVEIDDATIKEGFQKRHFLNLIKQEIESLKGQIAYAKDKVRYKGTPDWEKKEFAAILKDKIKDLKDTEKHYKRVEKLKEEKLNEAKETIFDVAARVMKDKQNQNYKSKKGMVKVDMQSANLLTKVWAKVNPKMKKILSDLGYKSPTQLMNTLWAVVK